MNQLFLLRHAKSSWEDQNQEDFDRPLNPRGIKTAGFMADQMVQRRFAPRRILCSTSRRTRETLAILLTFFKHSYKIELLHELYSGTALDYQNAIREHGGTEENLMVIAHNPCIQEATINLSNEENQETHSSVVAHFPTCALAVINFDLTNWKEMKPKSGTISEFVRPKEMPNYPNINSIQ